MARGKYIWCDVDDVEFTNFQRAAAKQGKHPVDLLYEWFIEKLQDHLEREQVESVTPPDARTKMFLLGLQHSERVRNRAQLKKFACTARDTKKDEDMQIFIEACEAMKVDPEDILDEVVGYDNYSAPVDSTTLASAIEWLASFIPPGEARASTEIERAGKEMGYSKSILKKAKREIGLSSRRESTHWVWEWPENVANVQ